MTAYELINYATWAVYLVIFVSTAIKAVRRPLRANIDIALFFLVPTLIVLQSTLRLIGVEPSSSLITSVAISLYPLMVYMLFRLVDDFSDVPPWLLRAAEAALTLLIVGAFTLSPVPGWYIFGLLAYLMILVVYSAAAFIKEARRTRGVTSRRMSAAAAGTLFLCLFFGIAALGIPFPGLREIWQPLISLAALASGICYFIGFRPPAILRSAWQEPELRSFLSRTASLPRLPSTEAIIEELERGAADSIGTQEADIGIWDESEKALRFLRAGGEALVPANYESLSGKAFLQQKVMFTNNVLRDSPLTSRLGNPKQVKVLIAAPISTEARRVGVLVTYASHVPIFADEDMRLIKLLADQAAAILESRALIDEATHVRTREEVTRLKEDFLSAAAHDLKTPLTTLVAQAQLMLRRAERNPNAQVDREGISTIEREATRLKGLVLELLDAARAEEGKLLSDSEETDLVALAREVGARYNSERHPFRIESGELLLGRFDANRIRQMLTNLAENAVKYSPEGGEVVMKAWADGQKAFISVQDNGIGIPHEDLPHIFERFHRGRNVNDRRFAGMGLGLYICYEIAKQHGGNITVTSRPRQGTTFTVELPIYGAKSSEDMTAPILPTNEQIESRHERTLASFDNALVRDSPTRQVPVTSQEESQA